MHPDLDLEMLLAVLLALQGEVAFDLPGGLPRGLVGGRQREELIQRNGEVFFRTVLHHMHRFSLLGPDSNARATQSWAL